MVYNKHPYKCIPGVPNLRLKYIVENGQLRKQSLRVTGYKDETVISINEVTETKPPKGFLRGAFNFGSVIVVTRKQEHRFQNVQDVKSFVAAIEGRKSDVTPQESKEQLELSNIVAIVPKPSARFLEIIKEKPLRISDKHFNIIQFNVGDTEKIGDRLLTFGKVTPLNVWKQIAGGLKSPCDGKILEINDDNIRIQISKQHKDIAHKASTSQIRGELYSLIPDKLREFYNTDFEFRDTSVPIALHNRSSY